MGNLLKLIKIRLNTRYQLKYIKQEYNSEGKFLY